METVKVKSWDESQGEFVLINAGDFNPDIHQLFERDPLDHDGDGKKGGSVRRKRAAQ